MNAPGGHEFDLDTAVVAEDNGRYRAEIFDRWDALNGTPNGGYVLALCTRALGLELDKPDPLIVSGFFLRAAQAGPAVLHVETLHTGRRHDSGSVRLRQEQKEVVHMVGTFADLDRASGRTLLLNEPPALPPPEQCVDPLGGRGFPGISITERCEYRMPDPPGWLTGNPTGEPAAEFWMRFKDDRPIDSLSLVALVDAAAPMVLEIGEGSMTVELTVHTRARPASTQWVACRATTRHVIDGYHEEDFEIWDPDGRLLAQSRQLALLPPA